MEATLQKTISLDSNIAEAYLALGAVFNQTKDIRSGNRAADGLGVQAGGRLGPLRTGEDVLGAGPLTGCSAPRAQSVAGMPDLAPSHALLCNVMLRESNALGALHEYQEYLRLDPDGSMAPGARQMIEKIQKTLHP